jgi:hypothetical protein
MDDTDIVREISRLATHEHELEQRAATDPLSDEERAALSQVEVQLDQCWDLLRQRRARRNAGQDPDDAHVRSADVVEHYRQ